MHALPWEVPARQLELFSDAPTPVATTPEPDVIELSENTKDAIRRDFMRGAMQGALLAHYGIDRRTLSTILADCIDKSGRPDDETLDRIFGPMQDPGATPDERNGIGASQKVDQRIERAMRRA